jgi:uncharacterized protein (TIGR03437 family)
MSRVTSLFSALLIAALAARAQPSRISRPIDPTRRVTLGGHLHPLARAESDQGRVVPSLPMSYVTLTFGPTPSQQADLDQLLAAQQNPASPDYHRWLTPEQYAQRFGVSDDDLSKIQSWLQSQGLSIAGVARGKSWIAASGTTAQFENALQTEIHQYLVDGETHFANSTEPSVPAALDGVVKTIRGLHDFRLKPAARGLHPHNDAGRGTHYIAPGDFATIYDIAPVYAAGIDGTGQRLVVAGQTQINMSDIQQFRTTYGLPVNNPQALLVPGSRNPGVQSASGDLGESDLDLEWSGAVAQNATILFVYAYDVMTAVQYAIDQNMAPVLSSSYGSCELETPSSDVTSFRSWAQQGNAQGMTWVAATGDSGAADCDDSQNPGLAVDLPGSIPEVTSVGGTEFQENSGTYWASTNNASGVSALSYIPETSWNDSAEIGSPDSTGGGASVLFAKPSWQTGTGVPSDNARHVPDLAFAASPQHDGYLVYTGGATQVFGGTSAPTPSFAGMLTLLNHYLVSNGSLTVAGLGSINPQLYSLAQSAPGAFHDVTTGNNIVTVPCSTRPRSCTTAPVGYSAGVGYDQVTGLGSLDFSQFAAAWSGASVAAPTFRPAISLLSNVSTVGTTGVVFLIATVTDTSGVPPTGTVSFAAGGTFLGSTALTGSAGTATATLAVNGSQLPAGGGTITATYGAASNNVTSSVTVNVQSSGSGSSGTPAILGMVNGASFKATYAPGGILAVFGTQLAPSTATAGSVPLPDSMAGVAVTMNGIAAPLYYVSPAQINVQIPYEIPAGAPVVLAINNNGKVVSQFFTTAAEAPAILTDQNGALVPNASAARGQIISLYLTGAGAVTPQISTGAAPPTTTAVTGLPAPVANTTMTVGGAGASIQFEGIPYGLVGVVQINFQVPSTVNIGAQPVVVTVGGVASSPAILNITN